MKKILPVFALVLMIGAVSGIQWSLSADFEGGNTYPNGLDVIQAECTGSDSECPGAGSSGLEWEAEMCGLRFDEVAGSFDLDDPPGQRLSFSLEYPPEARPRYVPRQAPCTTNPEMKLINPDGDVVKTETINYDAKNMDPNKGAYLYVELDVNPNKIRDFILTNDREPFYNSPGNEIHGVNDIQQGDVLITETDWKGYPDGDDDYGRYRPPDGSVLTHENIALLGFQSKSSVFTNNHVLGDNLGAEDVWSYEFGDINNVIGKEKGVCTAFETSFQSCTPAHDNSGDYRADAEILKANNRFYICRGSMDGETVDTSNYGELRCDVKGNGVDWRGNTPQSWIGYNDCADPVVGIRERYDPNLDATIKTKAVFMDYVSGGQYTDSRTGCTYNEIDTTIETGEPDVFICQGDNAVENDYTGNDQVTTQKDTYCLYDTNLREYPNPAAPQNCDGDGDCDLGDYHNISANSTALAVKYYVPKEAIPVGSDAQGFEGSDFATSSGFNNARFDHIHAAELDLLEGQPGDTYEDAYTHNKTKYDNLNISRGQAYEGPVDDTNQEAIRQVWNPSNATGQYSDGIEATDNLDENYITVEDTTVFDGGFYPSCETGLQWGYDDTPGERRWRCTGAIDWDLNIYAFEPSGTQQKDPAGYFAMPWEFRQSSSFFTTYYEAKDDEDTETAASIEEIRTVCWYGGLDNQPEFNSGNKGEDWFARQVSGIGNNPQVPVPVIGELELGSSDNVYSCRFEFDNSAGETVIGEGRLNVTSSPDVGEQQTRAQSILTGSIKSNLKDSWFNITKTCNGGSTCTVSGIVPSKDDLSGAVNNNPTMNLRRIWQQNLSYSFSEMSSGDLSSYMINGN